MAYSARTVANYLIEAKSKEGGTPPTPMQLLKLVYIAHGWNLAINDRPLINDGIEAWRYGPVIPKIYQDLKKWGNTPVRELLPAPASEAGSLAQEEMGVVDAVLKAYGNLSGVQLSNLTHASGTPWYQVYYDEKQDTGDAPIADGRIKQHFIRLASSKAHGK